MDRTWPKMAITAYNCIFSTQEYTLGPNRGALDLPSLYLGADTGTEACLEVFFGSV